MKNSNVVLGLVAGIAAGALLGILFAPHKGSKTREKIMSKGEEYAYELKDKFDGFVDSVNDKFDMLQKKADSLIS